MELLDILNESIKLIGNFAIAFLLVNVILLAYSFHQHKVAYRRLLYFLAFSLLIEISARLMAYSGLNNLPLLHLYTLGEFLLLSWLYKSLIIQPTLFQKYFWHFIFSISAFIVINSLFFQSLYTFNSLSKSIVQVLIITYAVLFFYNLTENQRLSLSTEKSLRLINSAILIYYSGSLFIFMYGQISFENKDLYKVFWAFNALLNLLFQLLILYGLWKVIFNKTSSS